MDNMDWNKLNRAYAEATRKAWSDPAFREKLLADPRASLSAEGVQVPADVTIKVLENTGDVIHLVLPARPSDALSEEALAAISAGLFKIGACVKNCHTSGGGGEGSGGPSK
jgi:hypothetical protein